MNAFPTTISSKWHWRVFAIALIVSGAYVAAEQGLSVKGSVVDTTGISIPSVIVSLYPTALVDTTDSDGVFSLRSQVTTFVNKQYRPVFIESGSQNVSYTLAGRTTEVTNFLKSRMPVEARQTGKTAPQIFLPLSQNLAMDRITSNNAVYMSAAGFQLRFRKRGYTSIDLDLPTVNIDLGAIVMKKIVTPITVIKPNGGETYHPGDTLEIEIERKITGYVHFEVMMSIDGGDYWYPVSNLARQWMPDVDGNYKFAVPDTLPMVKNAFEQRISAISDKCVIKVKDFNNSNIFDESDEFFRIETRVP